MAPLENLFPPLGDFKVPIFKTVRIKIIDIATMHANNICRYMYTLAIYNSTSIPYIYKRTYKPNISLEGGGGGGGGGMPPNPPRWRAVPFCVAPQNLSYVLCIIRAYTPLVPVETHQQSAYTSLVPVETHQQSDYVVQSNTNNMYSRSGIQPESSNSAVFLVSKAAELRIGCYFVLCSSLGSSAYD